MAEALSLHAAGTRIVQRAREQEEKRAEERRKGLVYLVANFLTEQGYMNSADALWKETELSREFEVCDNVDLETILLEYSNYYYAKFNKYPKLYRKGTKLNRTDVTQQAANKKGKPCKAVSNTEDYRESRNKDVERKCNTLERANDETFGVTIIPISPLESAGRVESKTAIDKASPDSEKIRKPIRNLYPLGSEWREIADAISMDIVLKQLNVQWDDIKGLNNCKMLLKEATVYPLKYPHLFNNKLGNWKGVLLYGPPGTGKTMLAKAVATECQATFFNITSSSVISKWRGDSEKYIRVLIELAAHYAPTIIFIDEIDWTSAGSGELASNSEPAKRFRAEFLSRLDGLLSMDNSNVILLATTNVPWNIDLALLRRLEKRIFVNLPDKNTRLEILHSHVHKSLHESDEFRNLLKFTEGYSCADLTLLCREAWMNKLRPIWKSLECKKVLPNNIPTDGIIDKIDYILDAMTNVKPIGKSLCDQYKIWNKEYGAAQ